MMLRYTHVCDREIAAAPERIGAATARAIPALVCKPRATLPSPHKTPEQEEAEEELLTRRIA